MAKPVLNGDGVVAALDGVAGARMSEGMRRHLDINQGWAVVLRQEPIFFSKKTNPESRKWLTISVEKKGLMLDALLQIVGDGLRGLVPKRNNALLATFAHERDAIGLLQANICDFEVSDLGNSRSSIIEQFKQGIITKAR